MIAAPAMPAEGAAAAAATGAAAVARAGAGATAQTDEAVGAAPMIGAGGSASTTTTASDVAAARACRRQVLRLVLLERKAVQWYPQPGKCALAALARRFRDHFSKCVDVEACIDGIGGLDRKMEAPLSRSDTVPSELELSGADLGKMATFLENEATAFESGLYALPTVSGSRLPDILLPYANVTFDESGNSSANERTSTGAVDEDDDVVEVVAPPSSACPATALATVVAPDVICIED